MAIGTGGRQIMGPTLAVLLVMYLIVLGLAGWSLDKYINGQQNHPHLGGNPATGFMLIFALIGGVIGVCSVLAGLMHLRAWRNESLAGAVSSAIISWALIALAFGLACKEISLGGHRGTRLQTLEAFIMMLTLVELLYLVHLHSGMVNSRYGPGYRAHEYGTIAGTHDQPHKTTTPAIV